MVERKAEILDAFPNLLQRAPTLRKSCMKHKVWAMRIIQNVKNFPASVWNPVMKYRMSEKQMTWTITKGISVMALAIQNAVGR